MLATAVFSVVLLIATVAVITVTRSYVKGDVEAETQDAARSILTAVTQDIQFNKAGSINAGAYDSASGFGFICVGNDTYFYKINQEISSTTPHALLVSSSWVCPPTPGNSSYWTSATPPVSQYEHDLESPYGGGSFANELLAQNLRLGQLSITPLSITPPAAGGVSYIVTVTVAYGMDSILVGTPTANNYYNYSCPSESIGGQFCAFSTLTTTVTPRIQ